MRLTKIIIITTIMIITILSIITTHTGPDLAMVGVHLTRDDLIHSLQVRK